MGDGELRFIITIPELRTKHLHIFRNCLRSLFLLVGLITALAKNPLDDYANLSAGVLPDSPIYGNTFAELRMRVPVQ